MPNFEKAHHAVIQKHPCLHFALKKAILEQLGKIPYHKIDNAAKDMLYAVFVAAIGPADGNMYGSR